MYWSSRRRQNHRDSFGEREDYGDDEDVMDYAFADNTGKKDVKTSLIDNVRDTMASMEKLGVLKDKNNINVNANSPRNKKTGKKAKSPNRNRKWPPKKKNHRPNKKNTDKKSKNPKKTTKKPGKSTTKYSGDITRRSTQQLFKEMAESQPNIINEQKQKIFGIKSENNHCAFARRSNDESVSQTINMSSSYINIDDDFVLNSHEKMKKVQTIFTNAHMTLCWIEITTTKVDKSVKPPKRLIIREAAISFENAATIPEEYLTCPIVDGDITMEPNEMLCKTSFTEGIDEDTRISRTVNLTKFTHEDNIDVTINKVIKCTMGPVITKDVYQWVNETDSTRQRVEIKVSPLTYNTEDICHNYNELNNLLKNDSAECSDSSDESDVSDERTVNQNINCVGPDCPGIELIAGQASMIPMNMGINNLFRTTPSESFTTNFEEPSTTIKPSITSEINEALSIGFTRTASVTEQPQISSSSFENNITSSPDNSCTGSNCTELINDDISDVKNVTADGYDVSQENNTNSSGEESCDGSCEDSNSMSDYENNNSTENNHPGKQLNSSISSNELAANEKDKLYIPKPFVCPVADEKVCAHLKQVSELQSLERSSEENTDAVDDDFTSARESGSSEDRSKNSKVTNEQNSMMSDVSLSADSATTSPDGSLNEAKTIVPLTPIISSSPVSILKSVETTTQKHIPGLIDDSGLQDSDRTLSSENASDDSGSTVNLDKLSQSIPADSQVLVNQTHNIGDVSSSKNSEVISSESEDENVSYLNVTQANESCDKFGNCKKLNTTNILRSTPSSARPGFYSTATKENESEDSESCDCDDDTDESKKCDPITGSCLPTTTHLNHGLKSTQSTPVDKFQKLANKRKPINHFASNESKNSLGLNGKRPNNSPNHKLSLKIFVSLEHIDENKENLRLAQVEKNIVLTELPDEHGNHSLYWQIQALNKSISHVDSLKDILNCTMLEKLTEDAIIEKLNTTDLNHKKYIGNNNKKLHHKRYRRNADNVTLSTRSDGNNNSSSNGDSVMRECILPNIREDIRNGLHDMLAELTSVLNNSRNDNTVAARIDSSPLTTSTTTGAPSTGAVFRSDITNTTESSLIKNSTVASRSKRSLMSLNNDGEVEEISRWTNERFIPSNDGGQLRSFTEMRIFKNSP
ncbi:hypothetical protein PV326_000714 [Microctonus aethiopoides]|nr:hypothetical protein PV326_000714 [Microctonus aethiopoides]